MRKKKGAFGVVYQDVVRSPKLTPEAKAVYAYLASMAGDNDECYPTKELMAKELNMSMHRLDKHLALLIGSGVVEKRKTTLGNLKSRNIYKVTHELEVKKNLEEIFENIEKGQNVSFRYVENEPIENRPIENRPVENRPTNNKSINNKSINNKDNKQCASDNAPKVSKAAIDEFFESIWKLYPSKKGKGQISDSKKKVLYDIGYEEMSRTIERYKAGLAKDEWRKPQNGSTFFNSGYIDYLDANYSEPEQITDPEEGDRSIYQDEEDYRRLREELG